MDFDEAICGRDLAALPTERKSRNTQQNVIASFMSWTIALVGAVLGQPIFVHSLGTDKYGLFLLATSVVTQLTSVNLNVGRALTRTLSIAMIKETNRRDLTNTNIEEILLASFTLCLVIAILSALLMAGCARWITIYVLKVQPTIQGTTITALYIGSAAVAATFINQFVASIPQALQRFDIYAYVTIGVAFATLVGNCVLATTGFGVASLMTWSVVVSVVSTWTLWLLSRRSLPKIRWRLSLDRQIMSEVARFGGAVTIYGSIGSLVVLAERVTVSRYCGTAAVAYYTIPMLMGTYTHGAIAALTLVIFPKASQAIAIGDIAGLERLYKRAFTYVLPIISIAVTCSVIGGGFALATWMGSDFSAHAKGLFEIHSLTYGLMAFVIIPWQVIEGMGKPGWNARLTILWAVIALPAMLILTPHLGIRGPAIARLLSVSSVGIYVALIEKRVFGKVLWGFWRGMIPKISVACIMAGSAMFLILRSVTIGWLRLGEGLIIAFIIFALVLIFTGYWGKGELHDLRMLIEMFKKGVNRHATEDL